MIFVMTTDRRQTDRQTKPIALPLAYARGVNVSAGWVRVLESFSITIMDLAYM